MLLIIGTMAFLIYKFLYIKTYTVTDGEISYSFLTDAVVIKNETLVASPASGNVEILVKSGERVRVGTPLFITTIDKAQKESYKREIAEVEEKIADLKADVGQSSISLRLVNNSIENVTEKLKDATEKGEFDKVLQLKNELDRLTEERQKIVQANESTISQLQEQLKRLKDELSKIDVVTYSPAAGIVSLKIDGYEDLLKVSGMEGITKSQFESVLQGINTTKEIPKEIQVNQPVVKIVDNFSYYLAFKLEKKMQLGRKYDIKIDNGKVVSAKFASTNREGSIGFFLINSEIDSILDSRKVRIEVVTETHSGKIIPVSALFNNDGKMGVYVVERRKKIFKPVEIVARDEENIIVNGLKLGDKILVK